MRANQINILNLKDFHNIIIYGNSREEVETYFKTKLNWGSTPVCISDHNSIVVSYKNKIEKIYNKLNKNKCSTWEEYNKKRPEDKLILTVVSWYGTAKEIASIPDIQTCLAKAWAAGFRFILGVTDGNNEKVLQTVNAHCECRIDLSEYKQGPQVSGPNLQEMKKMRNVCIFGENYSDCFSKLLIKETEGAIVASYPESVYLALADLDKVLKERYFEIYLKGFNDIYEYDKVCLNKFKPIVLFIKHCSDDMALDSLISDMTYRGYNAGIYFVFCYDKIPEYQSTAYTITSGRIIRTHKDGRSDNQDYTDRVASIYKRNKKETLECLKKYDSGKLFTPIYMDETTFEYCLENHIQRLFYEISYDSKCIVDIFED